MKRDMSVTIKPTLACNMRCKHCFNGDLAKDNSMVSVESVCRFLELVAKEYDDIGLTFHGGEPTLAGYDFYEKVLEHISKLQEKYGALFHINLTTNGLLLTNKLMDLLISHNVRFNVSFDGPCNDILRQHTEKIYNNLLLLKKKNADLRIYCTVAEKSYLRLFEIYEWFKSHNFSFKLVPVQPQGYAVDNDYLVMDPKKFVPELLKLYQYWLRDKTNLGTVFTFEEFLELKRNNAFKDLWFDRKLALNPDGKIYPFGRPNDIHYCLGNPLELDNINDCFKTEAYINLKKELDEFLSFREDYCKNCTSKNVCGGVTICSSYVYGDDEDMLKYGCELANEIFTGVLSVNEFVYRDFKNGNFENYSEKVCKYYYAQLQD